MLSPTISISTGAVNRLAEVSAVCSRPAAASVDGSGPPPGPTYSELPPQPCFNTDTIYSTENVFFMAKLLRPLRHGFFRILTFTIDQF